MEPITTNLHASESSHWYTREGLQVDRVLGADGKTYVSPDVRHARKLGLLPGVTGIIGCAARPALTEWLIMQGILASLTLPRRPHEPDVEYIKRIVEDSKAQGRAAADDGTLIHGAVQGHFEGKDAAPRFVPYIGGVTTKLDERFGVLSWEAERSFACRRGFGSKIDLYCGGAKIIVDMKGKEFTEPPSGRKQFHYDEHAMQVAAYDYAMGGGHVCANLFISRNVPGLTHIHVWEPADIARGLAQFFALRDFWCATRRYDPSWTPEEKLP